MSGSIYGLPTQAIPANTLTAATQPTGDTSTAVATDAFVANTLAAPPQIGTTTAAKGVFSPLTASGLFSANAGVNWNEREITGSGAVTLGTGDIVVIIKKNTGAATAVTNITTQSGRWYWVIDGKGDAATNNITFTPASGTVNGAATLVLSTNYGQMFLMCDGTNWFGVRMAP